MQGLGLMPSMHLTSLRDVLSSTSPPLSDQVWSNLFLFFGPHSELRVLHSGITLDDIQGMPGI